MCFFKKLKYQAAARPVFMNTDIREMNDLVMGGAGSGKSAYYIGNLLMQADGSYVVCDPEGKLYRQYGGYLEYKGYNVRCLDLVNAEKRTRYNPLIHLDGSSDSISFFVDMVICNTSRAEQAHDERDRALLTALVMYLHDTADESQQTIDSLNSLLQAGASEGKVLNRLIDGARALDAGARTAVHYDRLLAMDADGPARSCVSCLDRLKEFTFRGYQDITSSDNICLEQTGCEKTALFVVTSSQNETSLLQTFLYGQAIRQLQLFMEGTCQYSYIVERGDGTVAGYFPAWDENGSADSKKEAEEFLSEAKKAKVRYSQEYGWYVTEVKNQKAVAHHGSEKDAQHDLKKLRQGGRVIKAKDRQGKGYSLPVKVRFIFDGCAASGTRKIPGLPQKLGVLNRYGIYLSFIVRSVRDLEQKYGEEWRDIAAGCRTIFMGGNIDTETRNWIAENQETSPNALLSRFTRHQKDNPEDLSPAVCEDECLIIQKGNPVYKIRKKSVTEHPDWQLAESLYGYRCAEEKIRFIDKEEIHEEDQKGES